MTNTLQNRLLFFIIFLFQAATPLTFSETTDNCLSTFRFRKLSTSDGLPSNDVQQLYQDKDGFIWIATRNGISQYDGYSMKTFKSDFHNLNLLTDNNVFCMAEDMHHRLWIGTYNGLNMLDKTTGRICHINKKELIDNAISDILITRREQLFLATDNGLYEYIFDKDSCILYRGNNTGNIFPETSVKTLCEDSEGNLWIGTWNRGLYRYDNKKNKYYAYPQMNTRNSAHIVFEDSQKRIWVGSWGEGLYLLDNTGDPQNTTWKVFRHDKANPHSIADDLIYSISEDLNTQTLWVGTRSGLSILSMNDFSAFSNYYPAAGNNSISANEVNSIMRDNQGMMWLGMLGGGVNGMITRKPDFNLDRLEGVKEELTTNSVRSIMVDSKETVWMGVGTYGLVIQDRKTGKTQYHSELEDFKSINKMPTLLTIMESPATGKIWMGTYDGGIYIWDRSAPVGKRVVNLTPGDAPWLANFCVYSIKEDSKGNMWFGTRAGLSLLTAEKETVRFDSLCIGDKMMNAVVVTALTEGKNGEMWAATSNNGVMKVLENVDNPGKYHIENYSVNNGKLNSLNAQCIYRDALGRIWAGTDGGGLSLYNPKDSSFIPVHENWNLPGDAVFSILGDDKGELWIGTNVGLMRLNISTDASDATYRLYTTSDGLQDNIFNRNAVCMTQEGEMFFGGHQGYNYFFPHEIIEQKLTSPVIITDIKIFNQSWTTLDDNLKFQISSQSPEFTNKITLDYLHNNFNIEFTSLGFVDPTQNKYAYKLQGFDTEWVYTDASRRFAYYNNLNPGTYSFHLRATNSNGVWNERAIPLQVVILPPPWKTWWAYAIYTLFIVTIFILIYRMVRNRLRLRNALHLRELEQAKSEELNHSKLQFFTNITHELLTPLTIISATLDELKISSPQNNDYYQVMTNNINRLIRLLQQILEFRKAESGNLKLKVSKGDLAAFAHNSVESFRPLMKMKRIHFSIVSNPEPFPAYFDPDKMDKIIYNLLSNAAKYNEPGGTVWIDLTKDESGYCAVLNVRDNGKGMSEEAVRTLFQRFYEGDYRKFNTIGTGIGLSLTKDLVDLHGGTITVESEPGKGTSFKIVIPIDREAYKEEEIDDEGTIPSAPLSSKEPSKTETIKDNNKIYTLLLLEDNEELLSLMVRLLSADYNVFIGTTGKEGIEIIEQEDIDLIVSDIMMPEMDGIEFCKYVKGNFDTCHMPIILLTAKTREEDRIEAYDSGADAFISKPFNLSLLHSRIGNLLKARERVMRDFKKQIVFEARELNYTSLDESFLQKAINCVHKHLDDSEFDQQKFMEEMGASKSTLYRKLKSLTGLNSSAFIRNIRLKAACQIMEEKKHIRISELAYAVGFNDPKYFSACFKREFGIQPSEYIERFIAHANQYLKN